MISYNVGLSRKITKIRTTPVLVSRPKQVRHSPKRGFVFSVKNATGYGHPRGRKCHLLNWRWIINWKAVEVVGGGNGSPTDFGALLTFERLYQRMRSDKRHQIGNRCRHLSTFLFLAYFPSAQGDPRSAIPSANLSVADLQWNQKAGGSKEVVLHQKLV